MKILLLEDDLLLSEIIAEWLIIGVTAKQFQPTVASPFKPSHQFEMPKMEKQEGSHCCHGGM
ncbi:MAG: hypothetical protein IE889_04875 [Campylobacterales bacterium]|nr:hypothetical protein [Campylobacterales bacterium]